MKNFYDFVSVSEQWSEMYPYIFRYISLSIELMMPIDRGLYELYTDNSGNLTALLVVFK